MNGVQLACMRDTFDRANLRALGLKRRNEAAIHEIPIHFDGASTTFTLAAAFLGARKFSLFAQYIEQPRHRIRFEVDGLSVHGAMDEDFPHSLRHAPAPAFQSGFQA